MICEEHSPADLLEQWIDQNGIAEVLAMVESIALEKAEHLRANWNSDAHARNWERYAKIVGSAIRRLPARSGYETA